MSLGALARGLAAAFLASDWSVEDMLARGRAALGRQPRWLSGVAARMRAQLVEPPRHDPEVLERLVELDPALVDACRAAARKGRPLVVRQLFLTGPSMAPRRRFDAPELPTLPALAAWLGVAVSDLDWFADVGGWLARAPLGPLQHYHHHWIAKADGSRRLLEAPKATLKDIQRRILRGVLSRVPAHDAAHGFVPDRSIVSFAAPHCGQDLVLRMDLRDFFPSIPAARVAALFRSLGYPRPVASTLTGLVTTRTPYAALEGSRLSLVTEDHLRSRHLPQGAPTSPAISNLCAYRLDVRLTAAASALGGRYTRYADDLAFSGDAAFRAEASRMRTLVSTIARDEGFAVRPDKTRWMRPAQRQRLCGLVVNVRARPSRAQFDRLKAILHNCARHGPASQNHESHPRFEEHLRGRVAWFEDVDPSRGVRLRATFDRIAWPTSAEGPVKVEPAEGTPAREKPKPKPKPKPKTKTKTKRAPPG